MTDRLRAMLGSFAPQRLLRFLWTTRRWSRRHKFEGVGRHFQRDVVDRIQIIEDLRALGLWAGDTVLVHSSLSSLGYVEGGADTVVDALLAVIAPGGTLAMPSFPLKGSMLDYVQSRVVFDVRTTPSRMGKITGIFRQREGVLRSLHPTHSIAALGPDAKRLTEGHARCPTPFGPGSPFVRLIELGGKILCLGVEIAYITSYHALEDLTPDFPEPVYVEGSFSCPVVGYDGKPITVVTRAHNPAVAARRIERRPEKLREVKELLREESVLSEGRVGKANAFLLDAGKMNEVLDMFLREKGGTIYASE